MIIVVKYDDIHKECTLRWLWVGCAGQGLRPVKVFEQPAPRCRKPQCIRQPPRGVEPPPVPRPIARMPGSRTARLVRSPQSHAGGLLRAPRSVWWAQPGRQDSGIPRIIGRGRDWCRFRKLQGQPLGCCRGHLSPPIFGSAKHLAMGRPPARAYRLGSNTDETSQRGGRHGTLCWNRLAFQQQHGGSAR